MFKGEGIKELVKLLKDRGSNLYHACQLVDFQSYLNVGGIPSRAHLESNKQLYTRFETDEKDRSRLVWDKVFSNLEDFGRTFAYGKPAVPNPFGPILFQINPEALYEATDVAICLRSAGRPGFNRENEALSSIQDVDRLFEYPIEHSKSYFVKHPTQLQEEFTPTASKASAPEISCTVVCGIFPLHYVNYIRVEPYIIQRQPLQAKVKEIIANRGAKFQVFERDLDRCPAYTNELLEILKSDLPSIQNLSQNPRVSVGLRDWSIKLMERNLEYQFNRFAKYLYQGTILPILNGQL